MNRMYSGEDAAACSISSREPRGVGKNVTARSASSSAASAGGSRVVRW
jgi:hypothetical protein